MAEKQAEAKFGIEGNSGLTSITLQEGKPKSHRAMFAGNCGHEDNSLTMCNTLQREKLKDKSEDGNR